MSKLEALIERYCPHGVPYTPLGEVCELKRGKVISKEYIKSHQGEYPVYSSQTENNGEFGRISSYMYEGEFLTWTTDGAYAGSVFYRNGKFNITNVCGLLKVKSSAVNIRFLYHFLTIEAPKYVSAGMGNPKLMSNVMQSVKIPLPPLEVQREIVGILDLFTELTAELTAELELRKKQYAYYREVLLSFDEKSPSVIKEMTKRLCPNGIEWKTLGEVFTIRNGYTPSKANPNYWEGGTIPWFRMEDIRTNGRILKDSIQHITPAGVKGKLFEKESIILATTATIGEHALLIADSLANQQFTNFAICKSLKDRLLPKFAFYYFFMIDEWCKKNTRVSSFPSVDMKKLKKQPFPLPPLDIQHKIVEILDKFDTLTTSLTEGIPAEIEARRKQYNYYRNKLLTFKEQAPNLTK